MTPRRIAILGAGPIGVETAALLADREDLDIHLYEAASPGAHVRRWDHVQFFSPWEMNRSPWGEARLQASDTPLPDPADYPTGASYRQEYLQPLLNPLRPRITLHEETSALGVSRSAALKGDLLANPHRKEVPFLLHVRGPDGERYDTADVVIDATGVLSNPAGMGPGGLPALGEQALNGELLRGIPDVHGTHRELLASQRILLLGHGHSALTTLDGLLKLREDHGDTQIIWAFRTDQEPRDLIADDPLPERARLDALGNRAARGEFPGVLPLPGSLVKRLEPRGHSVAVTLTRQDGDESLQVDRVIANVGYRPDTSLYRELQVHLCYASDGPMKLAASLLSQSGGDCLAVDAGGPETLQNPEPNFFILGAKSYGRNSNFLLRTGFDQIAQLPSLLG